MAAARPATKTAKPRSSTKKSSNKRTGTSPDDDTETQDAWFQAHGNLWQAYHGYITKCLEAGASTMLDERGFPVDRKSLSRAQQMAVDRAWIDFDAEVAKIRGGQVPSWWSGPEKPDRIVKTLSDYRVWLTGVIGRFQNMPQKTRVEQARKCKHARDTLVNGYRLLVQFQRPIHIPTQESLQTLASLEMELTRVLAAGSVSPPAPATVKRRGGGDRRWDNFYRVHDQLMSVDPMTEAHVVAKVYLKRYPAEIAKYRRADMLEYDRTLAIRQLVRTLRNHRNYRTRRAAQSKPV